MAVLRLPIAECVGYRVVVLAAAVLLTGCASPQHGTAVPTDAVYRGEYGRARVWVAEHMAEDPGDRMYLLDRARLAMLTLADGYAQSTLTVMEPVYDMLRTQGLNEGKHAVAVAINEDLKVWKGEPFEQALAMAYLAMAHASTGSWDNARAASGNALFYLRDFGYDKKTKRRLDQLALARAAAAHDADPLGRGGVDLDHGFVTTESTFALGYLLHGLASQQLGRGDEAADYYRRARSLSPAAAPAIERFAAGDYNAVLVVSYGLGPRKIGIGPDEAVASFTPRTSSDPAALAVRVSAARVNGADGAVGAGDDPRLPLRRGSPWQRYAWVTDVNAMALDHMWNNLEDVRKAKSAIGDVLLTTGTVAVLYGAGRDDQKSVRDNAFAVGAGMVLAGAFLKSGAHADLRYNDAVSQRYYAVPLTLGPGENVVELQVDGRPGSRLVLRGLFGPESPGDGAVFRYVRLVPRPGDLVPAWAGSGEVTVGNPVTGPVDDPSPVALGGNDARPPSEAVLDDYQRAGHLTDLTLAQLQDVYVQRGLFWEIQDTRGYAGLHVLEGGDSLVSPLGGTAGFARLFCNPYFTATPIPEHDHTPAPPDAPATPAPDDSSIHQPQGDPP